jgi:putative ABC transport system permease protein
LSVFLIALLTIAVGIGASTAVFSLFEAAFLQSIPGRNPDRLVSVFESDEKNAGAAGYFSNYFPVSHPNFRDLRQAQEVFTDLAAYSWMRANLSSEDGRPEEVYGELVSGNYFEVFGIDAAVGRTFLPEEDAVPGRHPVIVISHGLWSRRFGSDPDAVGATLSVNGQPMKIVGVAAEGFKGPNRLFPHDYWIPVAMHAQVYAQSAAVDRRDAPLFKLVGRLKPGVEIGRARAAFEGLARNLEREYPAVNRDMAFELVPLERALIDPNQRRTLLRAGLLLVGAVGLVLLITCATLSNLLLALATGRRKEIAVRLVLGASRGRVFRQLLAESLGFALLGGALGLVLGVVGARLLWTLRPPIYSETALDLSLDLRVLGITFGVTLVTGVLFGLAPAFQAFVDDLVTPLKPAGGGDQGGHLTFRFRNVLVMGQVALSLVLLVLAGLCLRSMQVSRQTDPGYAAEDLFVVTLDLGAQGYGEDESRGLFREIVRRAESIVGTGGVALGRNYPLDPGGAISTVRVEGVEAREDGQGVYVREDRVDSGYLDTLGVPLVRGRTFDPILDDSEARPVAIINEEMQERFWPDEDPVGRQFRTGTDARPVTVVGVVENGRYVSLDETPQPYYFLPLDQSFASRLTLWVRNGSPDTPQRLREAIRAVEPDVPLVKLRSVPDVMQDSLWRQRLTTTLLVAFGLVALLLATAGIYGTMAYSLGKRRRELGIRMALGAERRDLVRMIVGEGLKIVAVGMAAGVVAALFASRLLAGLLHGIEPFDLTSFLAVSALLLVTALLACSTVGWRNLQSDPRTAMEL